MARDYVARNRRPPTRPAGLPGWVWLVAGLSMGLVVAVVVYIGRPATPMPLSQAAMSSAPKPRPRVEIPPAEKARFDFYTLLEKEQVVVPVQEPEPEASPRPARPPVADATAEKSIPTPTPAPAAKPAAAPTPSTAATSTRYLVVAGAFQDARNAEEHKARLAFVGVEADIERVTGQDRKTWHRVRIGPSSLERATAQLAQIKANGFDGRVVKLP